MPRGEIGMNRTVVTVDSLPAFVRTIARFCKKWGTELWYRGHANSQWRLRPRLYRLKSPYEEEIRIEFRRRAALMVFEERPSSDLEWYCLMQHYGAPTRLLDWSESALLGLYFAVRSQDRPAGDDGNGSAGVWVLDPFWLNKTVLEDPVVVDLTDEEAKDYLPEPYSKTKRIPRLPIAIQPPYLSTRISMQRSVFTIHGTARDGLEKVGSSRKRNRLAEILVPGSAVKGIRDDLAACGITETSVFPDLEGLSRELTEFYSEGPRRGRVGPAATKTLV